MPISLIASSTDALLVSLAPYIELLVGVLFAFFVLSYVISQLHGASPQQMQQYRRGRQAEIDDNDDDYDI